MPQQLRSDSPDDPTIRMVRMIFAGLMQQGLDALDVLTRAGIDPARVAEGRDRLPAAQLARAYELAVEKAGPDFGLMAGQAVDYRMFARLSGSSEYLMLEVMLPSPPSRRHWSGSLSSRGSATERGATGSSEEPRASR